jgi:hypothetical protein
MAIEKNEHQSNTTIIISIILIALFILIISVTRQLNFDESLALRAGWLYINAIETHLSFNMPIIWVIGCVVGSIEDPGAVIVILRIIVFISLAAVSIFIHHRLKLPPLHLLLWVTLCLTNGAFLTHGIEFRYDWAILVAWLIAFALISKPAKYRYIILGLILGWLLLHHLKGVIYALWLYIFTISIIYSDEKDRCNALVQFHSMSVLFIAIWMLILAALGQINDLFNFYLQFKQLAANVSFENRTSKILYRLSKDSIWWICALIAACISIYSLNSSKHLLWSLLFSLAPISFIIIHPLPWAYLVTPIVPFVAFTMAWSLYYFYLTFSEKIRIKTLCYCSITIFIVFMAKETVPQYQVDSLNITIQSLRLLKSYVSISDKIIDPSGTAYFIKPAHHDWYIDKLFRELAKQGRWQVGIEKSIYEADWALNTHRLNWLSDDAVKIVEQQFPLVCGPLRLNKNSPKLEILKTKCKLFQTEIYSAW